jgi:hypothetical protein
MQTPKPVSYQATIRDLTKRLEALERYNRSISAGLARDPGTGAMTVRLSADTGNQAAFGADGGLFVAEPAAVLTLSQGLVTATSPLTVAIGSGIVTAQRVTEHTYLAGQRVWVLSGNGNHLIFGATGALIPAASLANGGFEDAVPPWELYQLTYADADSSEWETRDSDREPEAARTGDYGTRTSRGYYEPGRYGPDGSVQSYLISPAPGFTAVPETAYQGGIWARVTWQTEGFAVNPASVPPTVLQVSASIAWYGADSELLSYSTAATLDLTAPAAPGADNSHGTWVQLLCSGAAPAGAVYGRLRVLRRIEGATVDPGGGGADEGDPFLHPFYIDTDDADIQVV